MSEEQTTERVVGFLPMPWLPLWARFLVLSFYITFGAFALLIGYAVFVIHD